MKHRFAPVMLASVMCAVGLGTHVAGQASLDEPSWKAFVVAAGADEGAAKKALEEIARRWRPGYAAMLLDLARFLPSAGPADPVAETTPRFSDDPDSRSAGSGRRSEPPSGPLDSPGVRARRRLTSFLEKQTGQRFGDDLRRWRRWIWSRNDVPHADYAVFKGEVYSRIDPDFRTFFPAGVKASIRMDEIDWGGVAVNGIPPLRQPKTVAAADASWLREDHVVFGVTVNGNARAYPKRILAWHELATDRLGGIDLTIVYCTLCGSVIPYDSRIDGRHFTFGTSGLLYRSNKLMFDQETRSLWSAIDGAPAVGSLVGEGLRLKALPVVTTTWGEWRRDHPATTVLSLDTGFKRDYGEGVAYRDYFATDGLMFDVPAPDKRLRNKAEVLIVRSDVIGPDSVPVAIAVDLLRRKPIFPFDAGGLGFVVLTSSGGANAVYRRGAFTFDGRDRSGPVRDRDGKSWTATPDALVRETGERLERVPAHRAFWFGWHAQHPDTILHR
ncbi:MAG: DUF3179 domain-containing protein [Vicinamibacterales bacterium]